MEEIIYCSELKGTVETVKYFKNIYARDTRCRTTEILFTI